MNIYKTELKKQIINGNLRFEVFRRLQTLKRLKLKLDTTLFHDI